MEIRGYGVVVVVVHGYEGVVVRGGYGVEVRENGEVFQRDCVAGYDYVVGVCGYVEVCGCVDHMDLAEIAEDLEADHVDVRMEVEVPEADHVDDQREGRADAVVDRVDVRREACVRGEDLVPAAVEC